MWHILLHWESICIALLLWTYIFTIFGANDTFLRWLKKESKSQHGFLAPVGIESFGQFTLLANFALLAKLHCSRYIGWKPSRKNLILSNFLSPCFTPLSLPSLPGYVVPMECVDLQQRINVKAAQPEKDTASSGYLSYFWEGNWKPWSSLK